MMVPPWWERHPGLLERELKSFADEGLDFTVDEQARSEGYLVLRGDAPAGPLGSVSLAVVYPGTFPHTRPAIYQLTGQRLDRHQNPIAGNYCLIGRASENWRPSMTAGELVAELSDLAQLVEEGGKELFEAEDPQGEPKTTYYSYLPLGCVLVPDEALELPEDATSGTFKVRFNSPPGWLTGPLIGGSKKTRFGQALLVEVKDSSGTPVARAPHELAEKFTGPTWRGRWVRPDEFIPAPTEGALLEALAELDERLLRPGRYGNDGYQFAIHAAVFTDEVRHGERGLSWVFPTSARQSKAKKDSPLRVVLLRGERYSTKVLLERIPELYPLRDQSAAVLGLGALGAPVTRLLAQAQIGGLRLADMDVVDAGTAVRWAEGMPAAGVHKALYLATELQQQYPLVQVEPFMNLVVGATANPENGFL